MPLVRFHDGPGVGITWRVEVPQDRLWRCVTEVEQLGQWLGVVVAGAAETGSELVVDHGDGYCCRSTVVEYAEPSRLQLTWQFPDEPASVVTVELEGSGAVTELRLSHGGLGDLADSYRTGWCAHLVFLEAVALGTPLPSSMFWPLHTTVARLHGR